MNKKHSADEPGFFLGLGISDFTIKYFARKYGFSKVRLTYSVE
jgi:hypothetical protein